MTTRKRRKRQAKPPALLRAWKLVSDERPGILIAGVLLLAGGLALAFAYWTPPPPPSPAPPAEHAWRELRIGREHYFAGAGTIINPATGEGLKLEAGAVAAFAEP